MKISEVKVKMVAGHSDKLLAFVSITLDGDFVVRDLKVIKGNYGYFVAMPSRKLTEHCPRCNTKNHLRAIYCNECGTKLPERKVPEDDRGRARLHADIAHPINSRTRDYIQKAVVDAYIKEADGFANDSHKPRYDYFDAGPE